MNTRGRQAAGWRIGISVGVVLLLGAAVLAVVSLRRSKPGVVAKTNTVTNSAQPEENGSFKKAMELAATWLTYLSPYKFQLPVPRGLRTCPDGSGSFTVRVDACTEKTDPNFRFRRLETLDALDPVAAFDRTFAQELRETGQTTIAGSGTELTGADVIILLATVREDLTVAIVTEKSPVAGSLARKVAVEVHRKAALPVDVASWDVDTVLQAVLGGMKFSVPLVKTGNTKTNP